MNSNSKFVNITNDKKTFFLENIAQFCDKCGSKYDTNDISVMFESPMSSIVTFTCKKCKATHVANFVVPTGISSRVPVNSDLAIEEIKYFAGLDKVSVDEVLDLYNILMANKKISNKRSKSKK